MGMRIANEVARMIKEAPQAPHKDARVASEDVEMVEAGYGTIVAMDQATSGVHWAPSKASNDHSGNVEDGTGLPMSKGMATRKFRPKIMKVGWSTTSGIKVPNTKTYNSMLERYIPSEYKEDFFRGPF